MNSIFFAVRRADLAIFRFARHMFKGYGLTPARFDLLFLLQSGPKHQTDIHQALGVCAPVISRMLKSLLELGLVRRQQIRKYKFVELTPHGRKVLRRAIVNVKKPVLRDVLARFGAAKHGWWETLEKLEGDFNRVQWAIGGRRWAIYFDPRPIVFRESELLSTGYCW